MQVRLIFHLRVLLFNETLNSYLARVNYSYLHKYNVTVSARADGSSRLGGEQ